MSPSNDNLVYLTARRVKKFLNGDFEAYSVSNDYMLEVDEVDDG